MGLLLVSPAARAAPPAEIIIAADATFWSAGGVTAPVTVTIDRYATDRDRDELLAALEQGSTPGAYKWLSAHSTLGTVQVGPLRTSIKFAYARSTADRRLITIVTAQPIAYVGTGLPAINPRTGFELGLVLLDTTNSGVGRGELIPATNLRLDADRAIVMTEPKGEVIQLSNIALR